MKKGVLVFIGFVVFLGFVFANEVRFSPSEINVNEGESFQVELMGFANESVSDFFGIESRINFDSTLLSVDFVTKGDLENSSIFNYTIYGDYIDIYFVLNGSEGVFGNLSFLKFNLTSLLAGKTFLNLSEVIWVNSTITNESAETALPEIFNVSLVIDEVSSSDPPPQDNSGSTSSGGGGSSSGGIVVDSNESNVSEEDNSGEVVFGLDDGEVVEEGNDVENESSVFNETSGSFFTGGVIGSILGEGSFFKSWAFWFVVGLIVVGVLVFLIRWGRKRVSHY